MCVTRVRHTERPWLESGPLIRPLARAAQTYGHGAPHLSEDQRARLHIQLTAALEVQHRLAHQSRRLTPGKAWSHGQIVNAYAPPMAPICTGTRHGPTQFGRTPGMIAAPAAGCIVALHLPVGHPRHVGSVAPLVEKGAHAIGRVRTRPLPTIPARAGDLALHNAAWREALHARGMLTVGIPTTGAPLPPSPTPEDVLRLLDAADWHGIRTPAQVHLAAACGYSRPVIDRIIASLLSRGAGHLAYKDHRGAIVHMGMAVMAHHAATVVRIHEDRLSKRARTFRRRLRLRCRKVHQCNASIH